MKTSLQLFLTLLLACSASVDAWAQVNPSPAASNPTPTASLAANTSSTATNTQTAAPQTTQIQLPPVALPRLSSIRIRIDADVLKDNKAFADVVQARADRDYALEKLAATNLRDDVSAGELKHVAAAVNAVNKVCAFGTDYIQLRMQKNSRWQLGLGLLSGVFGAATAAAPVISSAKALGISGLLASNYKTEIVENGDTGHSNAELKKVLEDVRFELANGIQNYNRALLMPSHDKPSALAQFRHLQAAVFEMHSACAYF
jgi:hypothetical protein